MQTLSRRRFLTIAACAGVFGTRAAADIPVTQWQTTALGARTTLSLAHSDAGRVADQVFAELRRLEGIFSLYRPDSALSRLNRDGRLAAPPFELLECLGLCDRIHNATGGLFDPTIQPLWAAHAQQHATGKADPDGIDRARALVGWPQVAVDSQAITLARPGMAITLNGIAQGYIADRIAALLTRQGLTDLMIDTGELRALGGHPQGGDWPVTLETVDGGRSGRVRLRDISMATSSPAGTQFDTVAGAGHILDPRTGQPGRAPWRLVSVTGPSAAVADGLSTAICLMKDRDTIGAALSGFSDMTLVHLS
ncbi:thiamine biosynthesis lipoprotein [Lutimaribacter pacificus]|uniref:FAD:protein FMN transferase n=1 Tax=Lutimaribacter pacificus TaxID=391948 RepID=A0A1H0NSE0_9RHOB|nr:FAD:protein FMN transferase [Lutimaribacter pacificus]SDO95564.1 thiamine biosynthesis lipoprotein [Lutimaribacter pacificus]SHK95738.1 thiamine biosynthesis lipoprotein [Lutimaribacter pacificus]